MRMEQVIEMEEQDQKMKKINPDTTTASLKVLRHKHVYLKLQRILGMLKSDDNQ